jgi:hypothetical protein
MREILWRCYAKHTTGCKQNITTPIQRRGNLFHII